MNIGYFFNGYLGDKLLEQSKDSPDGNAWYSTSIISELIKNGDTVFTLGENKDIYEYKKYNHLIFNSFEESLRHNAYLSSKQCKWEYSKDSCELIDAPELDLILLEWRFPIPGRNTLNDINSENFQYDYLMQSHILEKYDCPIIIFDLDYKLTIEDEKKLSKNIIIFETANKVKETILPRVSVEIPFWIKNTKILQNEYINKIKDIVYIGSRYERDRSIQEYIVPYSNEELFKVLFYGNWRKYLDKYEELYAMGWKNIQYHNRVGHEHFKEIYSDSLCCPLLAKDEYYKNGFMTARIQEALYFGSIPIGFKEHYKIDKYLPDNLIAEDYEDFYNKVISLKQLSISNRNELRNKLWKHLEFMDVSNFVKKLKEFA